MSEQQRPRRRVLRALAHLLVWPVVALALALGAAWWWTGRDDSLAAVLARAAGHLPAGQSLQASTVTGSLRTGGRIGRLRWTGPGLTVTAEHIEVGWDWAPLLRSRLHLSHLRIAALQIEQSPGPADAPPFTMPEHLVLPIEVDIPFEVLRLELRGPVAATADQLAGRYRHDRALHALTLDSLRLAAGSYQGSASLQARTPFALQARLQGTLRTTVPGGRAEPLALQASATLAGPLAGADAELALQALLRPLPAGTAAQGLPQADLQAHLRPWAGQPLRQARAQLQAIDLALFWPDLPRTSLSGSARVQPQGPAWQVQADLRNALRGPWDRQRLPLDTLQATLVHSAGAWTIEAARASAGPAELRATGRWEPASAAGAAAGWQGKATLSRIDPAQLHTRFAPASLNGEIEARSTAVGVLFDAALRPAGAQPAASPLAGLRIREASARGSWQAPVLTLAALRLATDDAQLQGQLRLHTVNRSGQGQLELRLPGGTASAQGSLAADNGGGTAQAQLTDAGRAARWLGQWPGMPEQLRTSVLQGTGNLQARWQGGYARAAAGDPSALTLQATLELPRLELRRAEDAPANAVRLERVRLELTGALSRMTLALAGEAAQGGRRVSLRGDATLGQTAPQNWTLDARQLDLQLTDAGRPGIWTAALSQPLALQWQQSAASKRLDIGRGALVFGGPAPGRARLLWEPAFWQRNGDAHTGRSSGRVEDLPLAWADLLLAAGGSSLANLDLAGNLVFGGQWDVQADRGLRVQASLERRSGDISVLGLDTATGRIPAGVRTARLTLTGDGPALRASLDWNSENAGEIAAELSTRLTNTGSGWRWPDDAAISGSVRARLPRVGAWSLLAPPGWRMRGTLEADAKLGGTRAAPTWDGSLRADDLALRSAVEGIELTDGRLRATLRGNRLDLTEFRFRGAAMPGAAGADSGGTLQATGSAEWLPGNGLRSTVQLTARALRISVRADRRLTVSGTLQAQADGPRLSVRGNLKADQALFILPEDSTPSLGADVVVKSAGGTVPGAQAAVRAAGAAGPAPGAAGQGPLQLDLAVGFDLGDDFRVQGRGLDTRLAGLLQLTSGRRVGMPLNVTGELRTVRGSYRAYGQALDVEQGVLRFSGAYDNPALDVRAIRPYLPQRVGVQITGTALLPRIRLFAEPELPDAEKLAWLVLGRSGANGGAEAAVLQQAALALLGGSGGGLTGGVAKALGLDELSFRGATDNTTAAAVTFGKRLSRDFYVSYERSLAGTVGTFFVFYDISQRLTLRAQTGAQSAIDLIFTVPYD